MSRSTRRAFLADVGRGMLVASLGPSLGTELGLAAEPAGGGDELRFGDLEPLVERMQETAPDALLGSLVAELRAGTELRTLVGAGALANARTFGGEDYTGYHAFMAMMPAYRMAQQLPSAEAALPVLKVLYRSTARILERGGRVREVLQAIRPEEDAARRGLGEAVLARDVDGAEGAFARLAEGRAQEAYAALLPVVEADVDVHRIVLAWRAWDVRRLTGEEHARTLLRQSVRYCIAAEEDRVRRGAPEPGIRSLLPALLERLDRAGVPTAPRAADDAWLDELSGAIFSSERAAAAEAVASALGEGYDPEAVGEALSLAANRLLRCDPGRERGLTADKPRGSVHGASVGVHASDAANAWRNVARVGSRRAGAASLIAGAYHTAGQSGSVGASPFHEAAPAIAESGAAALLAAAEEAIRGGDQARTAAIAERYGALGHPAGPAFDLMRRFAISEDGALHAEKYYWTVAEEFETTRPARRWHHMVGLARVTASEHGYPAPGVAEARRLLAS